MLGSDIKFYSREAHTMSIFRLCLLTVVCGLASARVGYGPGEQDWGFVNVRPSAHLFYWLYYTTAHDIEHYSERPLVIWLQGGPGSSSTGFGNFEQFGPWDIKGNPRNTTWVQYVNLLFIDSPVGAGYSYVDDDSQYAKTSHRIALDLVNFMKKFYELHASFINTPLHIFSESYGGKMAPEFALELYKAIGRKELKCNLVSVTVGNPWLSPVHTINSYAPFLLQLGLIDNVGYRNISHQAKIFAREASKGGIDFYNIQKRDSEDIDEVVYGYSSELKELMRGVVAQKLNVHDNRHEWDSARADASHHLRKDEPQSSVYIVRQLLNNTPVKVAFFSGQFDLICATPGTIAWIENMQWHNKSSYMVAPRTPIKIENDLQGYEKSNGQLTMFWVNYAGHLVQLDNPIAMTYILKKVISYK